jgi:hypothetical protein
MPVAVWNAQLFLLHCPIQLLCFDNEGDYINAQIALVPWDGNSFC